MSRLPLWWLQYIRTTSRSPTVHLSIMFSPSDLVVSVHAAQDWRCNGTRLQTHVTTAP